MDEVVLTEKDVPGAYLSKDPSEYTVPMLKRWLECHGQKKAENCRRWWKEFVAALHLN